MRSIGYALSGLGLTHDGSIDRIYSHFPSRIHRPPLVTAQQQQHSRQPTMPLTVDDLPAPPTQDEWLVRYYLQDDRCIESPTQRSCSPTIEYDDEGDPVTEGNGEKVEPEVEVSHRFAQGRFDSALQ